MTTTTFTCPACGQQVTREARYVRRSLKNNKRHVRFCSLKCSQVRRAEVFSPKEFLNSKYRTAWTVEEEQVIRRDYPVGGASACNLPGRTEWAIQCRASLLGVRQFNNRIWQLERAKLNQPLVALSRISKQFKEWAQTVVRQCHPGLMIRLDVVDDLPRTFVQRPGGIPPEGRSPNTPHIVGIWRSPTAKQVLNELLAWDEKRTINALRAAA